MAGLTNIAYYDVSYKIKYSAGHETKVMGNMALYSDKVHDKETAEAYLNTTSLAANYREHDEDAKLIVVDCKKVERLPINFDYKRAE